ncbi:MAG: hypothetical protein KBG15_18435 [Kofleriaceae bacterium]|nr:hypothetical protein [Kofleriaceae bacterium]
MAALLADLDEVTLDIEVDGEIVQRTLARQVIERGAWATVLLHVQKRDRDGQWRAAHAVLIRFAKVRGMYKRHASITLGATTARTLHTALASWFGDTDAGDTTADTSDDE